MPAEGPPPSPKTHNNARIVASPMRIAKLQELTVMSRDTERLLCRDHDNASPEFRGASQVALSSHEAI